MTETELKLLENALNATYESLERNSDMPSEICERDARINDLTDALLWCVIHPGECLGDHPRELQRAREALCP